MPYFIRVVYILWFLLPNSYPCFLILMDNTILPTHYQMGPSFRYPDHTCFCYPAAPPRHAHTHSRPTLCSGTAFLRPRIIDARVLRPPHASALLSHVQVTRTRSRIRALRLHVSTTYTPSASCSHTALSRLPDVRLPLASTLLFHAKRRAHGSICHRVERKVALSPRDDR